MKTLTKCELYALNPCKEALIKFDALYEHFQLDTPIPYLELYENFKYADLEWLLIVKDNDTSFLKYFNFIWVKMFESSVDMYYNIIEHCSWRLYQLLLIDAL